MVDLIYPVEPAGLYRGCQYGKAAEMLPVCDENGNVLFQAPRDFCHKNSLLHPVVHLNIINRRGSIVLQRRSADKEFWPLMWDFAAAGHVVYGEDVLESVRRESSEEISLIDFNPVHLASYVYDDGNERELVNTFAAVGEFKLQPDRIEVTDTKMWSADEIRNAVGKGILTPTFEYEYLMIADKLSALL